MPDEIIRFDGDALGQLLPICLKFVDQHKKGETIDIHDVVDKVGGALGIENVNEFALERFGSLTQDGLEQVFDADSASGIASVFAKNCQPVMTMIYQYAKKEITVQNLSQGLEALNASSKDAMREMLQQALGISDETAELLSEKFEPYLVSIYAFAGAFRIYQQAAEDAALAKAQRIEVERLANEAIAQLKIQRLEMETMVNVYMLNRLLPFDQGILAMDQAIVDDDDEGFIKANAELWELFGRESQFKTADEFDDLMLSDEAFKL